MPKAKPIYDWCGDQYPTKRKCEKAIAEALCEYLCDADAGSVSRYPADNPDSGTPHCISIVVTILPS